MEEVESGNVLAAKAAGAVGAGSVSDAVGEACAHVVGAASPPSAATAPLPVMHKPREEAFLVARGLELKTIRGYAYRGVDLDVGRGQVVAVRGRNGSGKTALLLTLAGRMRFTKGSLAVGGLELPHNRAKIERRVGLGLVAGLNELQENLTAANAVSAEFGLFRRPSRRELVVAYLDEWDLAEVAEVRVKDLTAEKLAQLGIALAFAGGPDAVVIDDVEDQLTMSQSEGLIDLLKRAARERNAAVVVGVIERSLGERADACIYLEKGGE